MVSTIHVETELPAPADRVWQAMLSPETLRYVCRGLIGLPGLEGRSAPIQVGEQGSGWIFLFHIVPISRHSVEIVSVDPVAHSVRTRERGGLVRCLDHTFSVTAIDDSRSRYVDDAEIDAGPFTPIVVSFARLMYEYRQCRWRTLVRRPAHDREGVLQE